MVAPQGSLLMLPVSDRWEISEFPTFREDYTFALVSNTSSFYSFIVGFPVKVSFFKRNFLLFMMMMVMMMLMTMVRVICLVFFGTAGCFD